MAPVSECEHYSLPMIEKFRRRLDFSPPGVDCLVDPALVSGSTGAGGGSSSSDTAAASGASGGQSGTAAWRRSFHIESG